MYDWSSEERRNGCENNSVEQPKKHWFSPSPFQQRGAVLFVWSNVWPKPQTEWWAVAGVSEESLFVTSNVPSGTFVYFHYFCMLSRAIVHIVIKANLIFQSTTLAPGNWVGCICLVYPSKPTRISQFCPATKKRIAFVTFLQAWIPWASEFTIRLHVQVGFCNHCLIRIRYTALPSRKILLELVTLISHLQGVFVEEIKGAALTHWKVVYETDLKKTFLSSNQNTPSLSSRHKAKSSRPCFIYKFWHNG